MTTPLYSVSRSFQHYVDIKAKYADIWIVLHFKEIGIVGYPKREVARIVKRPSLNCVFPYPKGILEELTGFIRISDRNLASDWSPYSGA